VVAIIDVNADVGEERGDDRSILAVVTSANVATGAHAGGGSVLDETVRIAVESGCAVGAHPSYQDRDGFGRTSRADGIDEARLAADLTDQVLLVAEACERHGTVLRHVKAHGALYHDASSNPRIAAVLVDAIRHAGERLGGVVLVVVGPPGSAVQAAAHRAALPFRREAFADRAYTSLGTLAPRSAAGAVLTASSAIAEQAADIALGRPIATIEGSTVVIEADTICLHGDTPGALAHARQVRATLEALGVAVASDGSVV
jgi:UPF0271 protein